MGPPPPGPAYEHAGVSLLPGTAGVLAGFLLLAYSGYLILGK